MNSRDEILTRVRKRLGHAAGSSGERRAAAEAILAARRQGPRPVAGADRIGAFCQRSLGLSSSVDRVVDRAAVPAAVARYLHGLGLVAEAVAWPEFADLDWAGSGIGVAFRPPHADDLIGITGCYCALAETGTLILLSGAQTPATTSLLPETHVAIIAASRIVAGMEDGFALLRAEHGALPRAVNFVSGPSRTGDIEQTIVIGAHGPYRVHLVVVEDA